MSTNKATPASPAPAPASATKASAPPATPTAASTASEEAKLADVPVVPSALTREASMRSFACTKLKIMAEFKYRKCVLREFDTLDCDGAPIIPGFPGEGITSAMCANYLVEKLQLPLIADIISWSFPQTCIISNFTPVNSVRIYGNRKVVVVVSELRIEDSAQQVTQSLVEAIFDFAKRHRSAFILAMEGMRAEEDEDKLQVTLRPEDIEDGGVDPEQLANAVVESLATRKIHGKNKKKGNKSDKDADSDKETPKKKDDDVDKKHKKGKEKEKEDKDKDKKRKSNKEEEEDEAPQLYYVCNDQTLGSRLLGLGHQPLETGAFDGITGYMLLQSPFISTPIVCVCAEFKKLDHKAAVPIITDAAKLLGVEIDLTDLKTRTKELQEEIGKVMESITGAHDREPQGGAAAMYI